MSRPTLYCPNRTCKAYNKQGIQIPLSEKKSDDGWRLECPYCSASLLQCENCLQLIEDTLPEKISPVRISHPKEEEKRPLSKSQEDLDLDPDIQNNFESSQPRRKRKHSPFIESSKRSKNDTSDSPAISSGSTSSPKIVASPSESFLVCAKCGFHNLYASSIRRSLDLPPFRPLTWDQIRLLQRCVAEKLYIEQKVSQFESLTHEIKRMREKPEKNSGEETANSSPLFMDHPPSLEELQSLHQNLQFQLQTLHSLGVYQQDLRRLDEFHFRARCKGFCQSHLKMLRALYEETLSNEHHKLFEQSEAFIKRLPQLIQIKVESEVSSLVTKRAHKILFTDSYKTLMTKKKEEDPEHLDSHKIIVNMLTNRHHLLQNLIVDQCAPCSEILQLITSELTQLYKNFEEMLKSSPLANQLGSTSHLLDSHTLNFATDIETEDKLSCLKSKIGLWRFLYKTVSAVVEIKNS